MVNFCERKSNKALNYYYFYKKKNYKKMKHKNYPPTPTSILKWRDQIKGAGELKVNILNFGLKYKNVK